VAALAAPAEIPTQGEIAQVPADRVSFQRQNRDETAAKLLKTYTMSIWAMPIRPACPSAGLWRAHRAGRSG
jgi:hypothetical protein